MARLIAIDRPGGPDFVTELRSIWERGDAAFPLDQRLPRQARRELSAAMGVGDEVADGDALVIATSGSTGSPKGVVLTHDAVAASAAATSARLGTQADDHWLACLPLSHVGGLSVVTRALHGGLRLTVHPGFDPDAVMGSGATLVSLVPTALRRIDPTRFRRILLGGARPPADRPANTVTTYGMTETGSGVVYDGVPLDGVEIDIRQDGSGSTISPISSTVDGSTPSNGTGSQRASGRILIRCPMLLRCYRDGSRPIDADGWFDTGDLGAWRADGRLHVDGRAGDLIITGGENVWPETVERALRDHPAVDDVMVRGVDDPEWGQIVEAVVVPTGTAPTLEALRAHVRERHPAFVAPRSLILADRLPLTTLGKPRRVAPVRGETFRLD